MIEHPRKGIYFDDCAPHHQLRLAHAVAILISMAMWVVIIVGAVLIFRAVRG